MLSIPDMAILGAAALIFFGPDQLPRVARKAGQMVREVQMTSQSFVREMERAADEAEERERLRDLPKEEPVSEAAPYVPDAEPIEFPMHDDYDYGISEPAGGSAQAAPIEHETPSGPAPHSGEDPHGTHELAAGP